MGNGVSFIGNNVTRYNVSFIGNNVTRYNVSFIGNNVTRYGVKVNGECNGFNVLYVVMVEVCL